MRKNRPAVRRTPEKPGEDGVCRCGHRKAVHLARWQEESVVNKGARCPDSYPCPGYVPRASRELPPPVAQPSERRKKGKKRTPTRERKEPARSPSPTVRRVRKGRPSRPPARRRRRGR